MFDRNELIHAAFSLQGRAFEALVVELATKHNLDPKFWNASETIHCL